MLTRRGLAFALIALAAATAALLARAPLLQLARADSPSPSAGPVGAIYQQIERPGSAPRIWAPAPPFAWVTPEGALTDLDALRGRRVVINFWATWCLPCRDEMPALEQVAARHPDIVFLEVDLQEGGEYVAAFFARYGLTHLQPVLDPEGKTTNRYGVLSLPTTFFVDGSGVIQHIRIGGPMSEDEIERGIAKASGGS